ncbi:MAG: SDR family oxidoreductase, partial [Pseudomonadota bacterium]
MWYHVPVSMRISSYWLETAMTPLDSPLSNEKPVVAVTGASRGIGHAIVKEFHSTGWEVLTLARTPFSRVCPWAEGIVKHIEVDLSDEASILAACTTLRERLGNHGLSALVNNAGISPKDDRGGRLSAMKTSLDTWHAVQMVNLMGPLMLCQQLLDPLTQAKGAVVNVTSIAGTQIHPFAGAA